MSSEEEIHTTIRSYLARMLVDTVKDTHLIQGEQISAKKLQKPRYVARPHFWTC